MALAEHASLVGPLLLAALEQKGFSDLTSVQRAVLDPALAGRDLRISSQTGSGKTVAIGLILRDLALLPAPAQAGVARPHALVLAPTRELAHQVERELAWLFAQGDVRLATATGGASYRDERRALARGPAIVVATPGRLIDHLTRGAIDASQVAAVVLDEADRMLDLGFREDIEAILSRVPATRATHLVSATFSPAVRALADRVQREARQVEGTRLGAVNVDIDHVLHVIDPNQRLDALINLLLANPDDQTIVFVRTRADVAFVANELVVHGFRASGLSGEMEQDARTRTLAAFRKGALRVLIATDVAARGIDVPDIARVIHAEPPTSPDAYTHRSGRTGRAGRKGTSALLLSPPAVVRATRLLRSLAINYRFEPIPSREAIQRASDERLFAELTADSEPVELERFRPLAARLQQHGELERSLVRLLARRAGQNAEPREIRVFAARPERASEHVGGKKRFERERPDNRKPRFEGRPERAAHSGDPSAESTAAPTPGARRNNGAAARSFTPFRVSWGKQRGADARRLLAMVCRRGGIRGTDVGAIRVEQTYSLVGVADEVAEAFARTAAEPDPREPSVTIRRDAHPAHPAQADRSRGPHTGERRAPQPQRPKWKTGATKPRPSGDKPLKRRHG